MHLLQEQHSSLKAQVKALQAEITTLELDAIKLGLAERQPTMIEEFRWPKLEVLTRWGVDVWDSYKRERIEERFKWK